MNEVNFVLSSQVTFNIRFAWSKRKEQKRGKKACTTVQRQKGIYESQLHFFFPRNTILALRLDIILSQIMIFLDSFVDVLDWDEYIIKRVLILLDKRAELHGLIPHWIIRCW